MLERCLIEFCSSTLASIKAASLFNITFLSKEDAEDQIRFWNIQLKIKGVRLFLLRFQGNRALIYVYREKQLASRLNSPEADVLTPSDFDSSKISAMMPSPSAARQWVRKCWKKRNSSRCGTSAKAASAA